MMVALISVLKLLMQLEVGPLAGLVLMDSEISLFLCIFSATLLQLLYPLPWQQSF